MNTKKQITILLLLLILPPFVILLSRQIFEANYFFSSLYKIIFLFPLFFRIYIEKKKFKTAILENFSFKTFKKSFFSTLLIGLLLSSIYLISFYVFKGILDLDSIAKNLQELISLNVINLIFIGTYIITINSLLEEFFWRGFMFKELSASIKPWLAHLFTGFAFSFHHIMFYYNWFTLPIFITVTLGLVAYAIIMNLIFQKSKDLYTCWLVHALVDIVQIFIAFKLFNII